MRDVLPFPHRGYILWANRLDPRVVGAGPLIFYHAPARAKRRVFRLTNESEFWAAVDKSGECWNWVGVRGKPTRSKYGHMVWQEKQDLAHRVAWMIAHGPIPPKMDVCHHCDNPRCVRPEHLFLGTRADNMADMVLKGRKPRGEDSPTAKLTNEQVAMIRLLHDSGVDSSAIGRAFHVSSAHVGRIARRLVRA